MNRIFGLSASDESFINNTESSKPVNLTEKADGFVEVETVIFAFFCLRSSDELDMDGQNPQTKSHAICVLC